MTNQDDNYLVITQKYVLFVRYNYKTSGTYGVKENRITNKKFTSALLNYMDENKLSLDRAFTDVSFYTRIMSYKQRFLRPI